MWETGICGVTSLRPLELGVRTGVIGVIIAVTALLGFLMEWDEILAWLRKDGDWLNWRFVTILLICDALIVGFLFHELWKREYYDHRRTELDNENLRALLDESERQRMTDVITGVPNGSRLTADLDKFFADRPAGTQAQIILIDIRDFRKINREHGFLKGDQLIRNIAQEIYQSMRRNEYMYQHPALDNDSRPRWKKIYRRYPGGDEFVFLIEGDQSAAVGFVVNRLVPDFRSLSNKHRSELGAGFELSFSCAIAPLLRNDTAIDALARVEDCFMRAAEGSEKFTICWSPTGYEKDLPADSYKKVFYEKARKLFQVMNVDEA